MGIIIRQSLKSSLVTYAGVLIGAANVLWLLPRYLDPDEIGLIYLLEGLAYLFANFASLGSFVIADKFFPVFKNESNQNNGFFVFLLMYTFIAFLLFSILFLIFRPVLLGIYANNAPEFKTYEPYILAFTLTIVLISVFESYARIHLRIAIPNLFREVGLKLLIIISVFLFALHLFDFQTLILIRILCYFIIALSLLIYLQWLGVMSLKFRPAFISRNLLNQMVTYGLFIVVGGAGTLIVVKVDALMIPAMIGNKALGIYEIAFFMGTVLEVPRKAISQISSPILSQAWAKNDLEHIKTIYTQSSVNQSILGVFLFLGIWCNAPYFYELIPNGMIYKEGIYVVFFVGLTRLLDMATGVNSEILLQSRFYKFNLICVAILAVLIVLLNLLLIPQYHITGAALAFLISYLFFNLIKFLFIYAKTGLQPFSYRLILILAAGFIAYILQRWMFEFQHPLLNMLLKSAVLAMVYLPLILWFKISKEFNQLFFSLVAFKFHLNK